MRVWTIANQKGGVGKTTTAVALAGLLAEKGNRVLLLDLDPHGSLTSYFRYNPDNVPRSCYDLFHLNDTSTASDIRPLILNTTIPNVRFIPASTSLATVERQLHGHDGVGLKVTRALAKLKDDFNYVLIDTPPVLGVLLINALAASEQLIIPVQTDFLAIKGLERMLRTLSMVTRARKKELAYTIVPTMYDRRTHASISSLHNLRQTYPEHIWHSMIPVDTRFREASKDGMAPSIYDPHGHGVKAYRQLVEYVLGSYQSQPEQMAAAHGSDHIAAGEDVFKRSSPSEPEQLAIPGTVTPAFLP